MPSRTIPICDTSGLPITECPHEVKSVSRSEYEPTLISLGRSCSQCGSYTSASTSEDKLSPEHKAMLAEFDQRKALEDDA